MSILNDPTMILSGSGLCSRIKKEVSVRTTEPLASGTCFERVGGIQGHLVKCNQILEFLVSNGLFVDMAGSVSNSCLCAFDFGFVRELANNSKYPTLKFLQFPYVLQFLNRYTCMAVL